MANEAPALNTAVQENVNTQGTEPVAAAVDPRDAIFARKEAQLVKQQQAIKAERDALKAKIAEYETGYVQKSRLKDATWDVLNENGVDYNKLTEELLNQPNMNDPATRAMMNKLKALEDKQLASERQQTEAQQAQRTQAENAIRIEATQLIDSDPRFETIKAESMTDAVMDLIISTFDESGVLMDIEDAAEQVETYLVDTYERGAKYSKVQSRLQPKAPEVPVAPKSPTQSQPAKITTLNNNITSQSSAQARSDAERRARAMAAFRGELK